MILFNFRQPSRSNIHEDLSRKVTVRGGSDRSFGLVIATALTIISMLPLRTGGAVRYWLLIPATVLVLLALIAPTLLRPLNTLWTRFGVLLSRVVNPVVTALLFALVFVPVGLIARLHRHDP